LSSLAAVIHQNKSNAAGNNENVVHPWFTVFLNLCSYFDKHQNGRIYIKRAP